ncbi:uncharacterized protein LOC133510732 [Syngnathoides biaculeatus]|uniref:uncharacterized protein LOC133510732 n=1 Tax=Syngnathoides biaculeatus TaxID=300417 RepID=UPI002ADE5D72|nr:uncharacterized protein LOC133510732 [Syngnathoides biaculeatus]
MELALLLLLGLLHKKQAQGIQAETRFVKLGTNLTLELKKTFVFTQNNDQLFWNFNTSFTILRADTSSPITIYENYSNRVTLLENFALILRNVHALDNGYYTAVLGGAKQQTLADYNVQVQAAVSPVKLEVASMWNDMDTCNMTVTCRADTTQLNLNFECHKVCSQNGSELLKADGHLKLISDNYSIVCEHSNNVSKTEQAKNVHICALNLVVSTWKRQRPVN